MYPFCNHTTTCISMLISMPDFLVSGAISSQGSNITLDGDTTFADNSAGEFGGETNYLRA